MPLKVVTQVQSLWPQAKRQLLVQKYIIRCIDHYDGSTRFLHISTFYSTPKSYAYMFFNRPDTSKVRLPMGHLHPMFHGPTQLTIANCISTGSAILHSSWWTVPILYSVCYSVTNAPLKKLIAVINTMLKKLIIDCPTLTVSMWCWEVLRFRRDSWNSKPRALSESCVNVL